MKAGFSKFSWLLGLVIGFQLIHISLAQVPGNEDNQKEVDRARDVVRRLREGKKATQADLDILEVALDRLGWINNPQAGTTGSTVSAPPVVKAVPGLQSSQDKRNPKPPPPPSPGLSQVTTKEGPVYMYVVDLDATSLQAFWLNQVGRPYESIDSLLEEQRKEGNRLTFAINGGIFDQLLRPKGLYVEQGKIMSKLDLSTPAKDGGNFYLQPNGVFLVDAQGNANILSTQRFGQRFSSTAEEPPRLAVQSGPLLVLDGAINPQFTLDSNNKKRRSGVGVIAGRRIVFGISVGEISFHEFATAFTSFGCHDALYLDGGPIPSLYVEGKLALHVDTPLVTMLGVTAKSQARQ